MKRIEYCLYFFLGVGLIWSVGCSTGVSTALRPDGPDGSPYQTDSSRHYSQVSGSFWSKTRDFFAPDWDEDSRTVEQQRILAANGQRYQQPSSNQQDEETATRTKSRNKNTPQIASVDQPVLLNPHAYQVGSQYAGMRPGSLYSNFGHTYQGLDPTIGSQAFQSQAFRPQNFQELSQEPVKQIVAKAEMPVEALAESRTDSSMQTNNVDRQGQLALALQSRRGDSKEFREVLWELSQTDPEELPLSEEELITQITRYRDYVADETDAELKSRLLERLRERTLPESSRVESGLTAQKTGRHSRSKRSVADDLDDDHYAERSRNLNDDDLFEPRRAPIPRRRTARLPDANEQLADGRHSFGVPGTPMPAHQMPRSKYGQLTQIEDPNIAQVNYQGQQAGMPGAILNANYQYPGSNAGQHGYPHPGQYSNGNGSWSPQARMAADMLRREIEQSPTGRTFENEIRLRLLELALGNRSEAVRPFTTEDKPFCEAWSNLMLGVSTLYDDGLIPERKQRIASAAYRFDEASLGMNKFCPLGLRNVQFVKDWQAFGIFLAKEEDCRPGERVGIYMELDNPTIRTSAHGFNVSTSVSYEIIDKTASVVEKSGKIPIEETTPSQKRDYCVYLDFDLPESLARGEYQLRIRVTDMNSDKLQYAEEQIPLRITSVVKQERPGNMMERAR